jgi:hypothetical protein
MIEAFLRRNRPAVIRGGAARSRYKREWSRAQLLARYGDACFSLGGIPYEDRV